MGGDGPGAAHEIPPGDRGVFSEAIEAKLWRTGRYAPEDLSGREARVGSPLG